MYIDPVLAIAYQRAELQRLMVEIERRRIATERRAADQTDRPLRKASKRTPIRTFFRTTVEG